MITGIICDYHAKDADATSAYFTVNMNNFDCRKGDLPPLALLLTKIDRFFNQDC